MPLASQYLLLVLYNVQAYIKMLFWVTCQIEYFIVEIFIEDTQYLSLSCPRYQGWDQVQLTKHSSIPRYMGGGGGGGGWNQDDIQRRVNFGLAK